MVILLRIWFALAHFLNKGSRMEDAEGSRLPITMRMEAISGIGLVIYGFTVTFASVDWVMSLEPRWYSTDLRNVVHGRASAGGLGVCHHRPYLAL